VNRIIFAILILALLFLSCEKIEPDLDNPLDPDNPDYESPSISIIAGPADGVTVETSTVEFEWEGNDTASLYRYKFSDDSWTDWTTQTSVVFDYLDEEQYNFQVQSSYPTGDTSSIISISFTVDAVQGPALMFYPRRQFATVGDTVSFQILAEEVENLTATEFSIIYNTNQIEIVSIVEGTMCSGWGESIFLSEINNTQGVVSIISALIGGEYPSVSGTGELAELKIRIISVGETSISFDGSEVLRNPDNVDIQINQIINGQINVQ